MKNIVILLLALTLKISAQTISPDVINSAGQHYPNGVNGVYLSDNIGEPMTETYGAGGSIMITQGFLQPEILSKTGFGASVIKNDVSCRDKKDGNISIAVSNIKPGYQVNYYWSPSTICPGNNCSSLDSLESGTYSVMIVISYTFLGAPKADTLLPAPVTINDLNGPCRVKIFSGVTPNGDGNNDIWFIENISEFPNNKVSIFNRWGHLIFETEKYDNITNAWPKTEELNNIVSSTYFYVLDLGDGTKPLKGWVELIKN